MAVVRLRFYAPKDCVKVNLKIPYGNSSKANLKGPTFSVLLLLCLCTMRQNWKFALLLRLMSIIIDRRIRFYGNSQCSVMTWNSSAAVFKVYFHLRVELVWLDDIKLSLLSIISARALELNVFLKDSLWTQKGCRPHLKNPSASLPPRTQQFGWTKHWVGGVWGCLLASL